MRLLAIERRVGAISVHHGSRDVPAYGEGVLGFTMVQRTTEPFWTGRKLMVMRYEAGVCFFLCVFFFFGLFRKGKILSPDCLFFRSCELTCHKAYCWHSILIVCTFTSVSIYNLRVVCAA